MSVPSLDAICCLRIVVIIIAPVPSLDATCCLRVVVIMMAPAPHLDAIYCLRAVVIILASVSPADAGFWWRDEVIILASVLSVDALFWLRGETTDSKSESLSASIATATAKRCLGSICFRGAVYRCLCSPWRFAASSEGFAAFSRRFAAPIPQLLNIPQTTWQSFRHKASIRIDVVLVLWV